MGYATLAHRAFVSVSEQSAQKEFVYHLILLPPRRNGSIAVPFVLAIPRQQRIGLNRLYLWLCIHLHK